MLLNRPIKIFLSSMLFLTVFSSFFVWFNNKNAEVEVTETPIRVETNIEARVTAIASVQVDEFICEENCKQNCETFPVSKQNSLDSSYIPQNLESGRIVGTTLQKNAYDELINLINDAKSKNLNIKVQSSYRSYQTQMIVFNGYVNNEMRANPSLTRTQAEEKANVYSAKPGHSEHQLGTTVDLTCVGCTPFTNDLANQKVYDFIRDNGYKFGFVVSYPENTTYKTGYKYEPWHIRFIGKDLANEYQQIFNNDNLHTLQEFLESKCNV